MRSGRLGAAIFGLLGCSQQTGNGASNPFVGSWSCTETVVETGAGPGTSSSVLTVTAAANGKIIETATELSPVLGPTCTFTASTSGSSFLWAATLDPGQCSVGPGVTLVYTTGTETVNGATLTYEFPFTQMSDAGSAAGTVSAVCTKVDASL